MWPDDGIKSCPIFPNIDHNVFKSFLHESCSFGNCPKIYQNIWATFAGKFVTKKFKKSPNLVTLPITFHHISIYLTKAVIVGRPANQCDQIGRFFKVLGDKFAYKSIWNTWWLLGFFKTLQLGLKWLWLLFGQLIENFGQHFVSTSGHTATNSLPSYHRHQIK